MVPVGTGRRGPERFNPTMTPPSGSPQTDLEHPRGPVPGDRIARDAAPAAKVEPRWPAALTIAAVFFLVLALPERVRLVPHWLTILSLVVLLVPMAAVTIAPASSVWPRIERAVTLVVVAITTVLIVNGLKVLLFAMIYHPKNISALSLLSSAVAVWVLNVLVFSLLYWQLDRGGPSARATAGSDGSDWLFPQMSSPERAPAGWRPAFPDYLFLGFTAATAFSPTDTLPLTVRAKMLMMFQASISLVSIVMVGARAINVLGA